MKTDALLARAQTYLESARLLLDRGDVSSAVSRGYYAMFYAAEALLLSEGLEFGSHKGVIAGFGEAFVKTGRFPAEAGRDLSRLFKERQHLEYDATASMSRAQVGDLISKADVFVKRVRQELAARDPGSS